MMYDFARYLNIRSAIMPVPSPDGSRVAFLSDISGNYQVWSAAGCDDTGEWPIQLTFFPDKVWEIHGSPQMNQLIAVGDVGGNERQQFYLISNYGRGTDGEEGHDIARMTKNDNAVHRFGALSSDGQTLAYTSNAENGIDFDPYLMDIVSGTERKIADTAGNRQIVAWSPDGSRLLIVDAVATEQLDLYTVDVTNGAERHVTAALQAARYQSLHWKEEGIYTLTDRHHDNFALSRLSPIDGSVTTILTAGTLLEEAGAASGELDLMTVTGNGVTAAVTLNADGYSYLYFVNLADGRYWSITDNLPAGVISNLVFNADGSCLLFDLQGPNCNPNIWSVHVDTGIAERITNSSSAGIHLNALRRPQSIAFPTFDGLSVPAYYYTPDQDPPPGGFPCILYVHGGPTSQQRPDFDVRFQYFLAHGYALLATNVRGSTGYGRNYMMLDDVEKRLDSVRDLKYAVKWLHERQEIASDRIAVYGRSYGGFMVLAALTHYPELFAAGIDVVGIADWVTFLERTSAWRRPHREREYGSLAKAHDLLVRMSPIHQAERIQMPLMVLAGDNDPRVPLYESEQIVDKVRAAGGTAHFVHYADEGHRFSKLANRIDSFTQMAAFLDQHLAVAVDVAVPTE